MFKRLLQLVLLMAIPVYAQVTFTYPALSTPNVWTNSNTFNVPVIFNSTVAAAAVVPGAIAGAYYASSSQTIAMSMTQCLSNSYVCQIVAPALYALTELPAWSQVSFAGYNVGPQSSSTQQLSFFDQRGGSFNRTYIDPVVSYGAQGVGVAEQVKANYTKGPILSSQRYNWYNGMLLEAMQTQGGLNAQLNGLNGKTTLTPLNVNLVSNTAGQKFGIYNQPYCFGIGDCVGFVNYVSGPAGFRDPGDEGIEVSTSFATETINVYRGTLSGSPTTGATSLTVVPTGANAGANETIAGTQGEGRWVLDTTSSVTNLTATAVTDNVQQFSSTYGYFSTVAAASGIVTSTGYGTITAAVTVLSTAQTPGSQVVPYTVTGTLTTGLACIADQTQQINTVNGQGNFETINITNVSGGSLTAVFQRPHPSGAAVFQGGQCGTFAEIVQDTYPTGSNWSEGETGGTTVYPVRHPWPVLGSIDGANLIVWTARSQGGGFWSTFKASTGSQAVNLYRGAEAYKVAGATNDTTDNQFTLAPNNATWANGDSVEESHYPAQQVTGGFLSVSSFGEHHGFGRNLLYADYVTGAENQDMGLVAANLAPYTTYSGYGGQRILPNAAFYALGSWKWALETASTGVLGSVIGLNSSPLGASTSQAIVQALGLYSVPSGDTFAYRQTPSSGTGGTYEFWAGGYNTSVPREYFNKYGIQMDQSSTNIFPQFSTVPYVATSTTYEGMGHVSGALELDSYNPTFGYSGIGMFVAGAPNSTSAPTNFDYSFGRQGLYMTTGKCLGWGASSTDAGTPSTSITPTLGMCYSSGNSGGIAATAANYIKLGAPDAATSDVGVISSDCAVAANCASLTTGENVVTVTNTNTSSTGHDIVRYNPTTADWTWSAGATGGNGSGNTESVSFGPTNGYKVTVAGFVYQLSTAGVFSAPNLSTTGVVTATAIESGGTKFTTAGCSVSSTTGGASAGKMTLGANTCSVVITMAGATGVTAAHGWFCQANDETTAAGNTLLYFTANSTTTATLSVPATAGATDVIDFGCMAF